MHFKIFINFYKWNNFYIRYYNNDNTQEMAEVSKNRYKPFVFLTEIFRIGNIVFKYYEKCPYRNKAEVVSISLLILNVTKMQ